MIKSSKKEEETLVFIFMIKLMKNREAEPQIARLSLEQVCSAIKFCESAFFSAGFIYSDLSCMGEISNSYLTQQV